MDYSFGKTQVLTSNRMTKRPELARLVYKIFGYTSLGNYARAQVFKRLLHELPVDDFEDILDLGCGMGEYSFMIAEGHPDARITAIDILPDRVAAVKRAREELKVKNLAVYQSKIEELPPDQKFDFIFSVDVFEHIPPGEMPFKEAFKRLREGGFFLVKIPSAKQQTLLPESLFEDHNEWLEHEHVGQVYELEGLKNRFEQENFSVKYAAYADGPISRLAWEIAYLSKKGGPFLQLLLLPLCKAMVKLDLLFKNPKRGNTIQVIGRKELIMRD